VTRMLVLVACMLVAAGCTSSSSPQPEPSFPNNPNHAQLLRRAALDRCPASSSQRQNDLPDLTLPCLGNGPAVHLSGVHGLPILVNVWGSWCGPCQRETPFLSRAYQQLKGKVQFLGVDDEDSSDSALDFAAHVRPPMHYPSVVDDNKQVLVALRRATAVPMTLFVRSDGSIANVHIAPYDALAPLLADIKRYLAVQP